MIIFNIPESEGETIIDLSQQIFGLLKINSRDIDLTAHHLGRKSSDNTRPILLKLISQLKKNLKN